MSIPPFVDRSFGMPPANIVPRLGAAPYGAEGAGAIGAFVVPALFALARALVGGGLNPAFGTGGAALTGATLVVVGPFIRYIQVLLSTYYRGTAIICLCFL